MKMLIAGMILALSTMAQAHECVDATGADMFHEPEKFQQKIAEKSSCYEAVTLANACAYGSSLDLGTTAIASEVCYKELGTNGALTDDLALLEQMKKRCDDKFADQQGTMYLSFNAYCKLDALEWITGLSSEL